MSEEQTSELAIATDIILDLVSQHACAADGEPDSMALSANADAICWLAERGYITIEKSVGRMVIGKWAGDDE